MATHNDPNKSMWGNLEVVNTLKKLPHIAAKPLTNSQRQECADLIAQLAEKWKRMFQDKARIEGTEMRLDQQNFFNEDTRRYSNTALQNNTEPGARGREHTHSYSAVLIDTRAEREANIPEVLMFAHRMSLVYGTMYKINVLGSAPGTAPPPPPTAIFVCSKCGNGLCLPVDLIERGRATGSYPPDQSCPRCKTGILEQQA